jgi:methylthioribose-1-phosphate isomerase
MRPLNFEHGILKLIDQTQLPTEYRIVECRTYEAAAAAIKDMIVRGAPAIGVTAAYGIAMGAAAIDTDSEERFFQELQSICAVMRGTRPTAVNLFWAVDRMLRTAMTHRSRPMAAIQAALLEEAAAMDAEDVAGNQKIGEHGNTLIKENSTILTHCNAGALATCDYGTALAVIRVAHQSGKKIAVFADETRPYLQGSRLTAWELKEDGIPVTLICDNMAGHFMKSGVIDCVIVGADRIASNGDTANKIGTYSLAVLAKEHQIPFYVAAPLSTFDFDIAAGDAIPIEERAYITAIITEKGVVNPPFPENVPKLREPCR